MVFPSQLCPVQLALELQAPAAPPLYPAAIFLTLVPHVPLASEARYLAPIQMLASALVELVSQEQSILEVTPHCDRNVLAVAGLICIKPQAPAALVAEILQDDSFP